MANRKFVGVFFADDTEILINSREEIGTVVHVLRDFAKATGQHLHPDKSVVLPIGQKCSAWMEIMGQRYQGLNISDKARALGITFHAWAEDVTAEFEKHKENIRRAYDKLSKLKLSALGRGILAPVYGTSRFLYAAEYAAVPTSIIKELTQWTKKLVDKGIPPNKTNGKFQGVNTEASAADPS